MVQKSFILRLFLLTYISKYIISEVRLIIYLDNEFRLYTTCRRHAYENRRIPFFVNGVINQ